MQKRDYIITLTVILLIIISAFAALVIKEQNHQGKTGDKVISVTIVNQDKTQKLFKISTDSKTLGGALLQRNLVTPEEYKDGFYTQINGIRADYKLDGAWWCFTKNGEELSEGVNQHYIKDGDCFEITHTPA